MLKFFNCELQKLLSLLHNMLNLLYVIFELNKASVTLVGKNLDNVNDVS